MYRAAVMGDRDSIYGFAAIGLDIHPVTDLSRAGKQLRVLVEGGYAVIYVTEAICESIRDELVYYKDKKLPAMAPLFFEVVEKQEAVIAKSKEAGEFLPTIICSPLMIRGQVFGVLTVKKDGRGPGVTSNDMQHIQSLTKRASLNLENKVLYESLYGNLIETFKSLVASIQVRDHYTEEHSYRVMNLALEVAEAMGCDEAERESLRIAGILHDVPEDTEKTLDDVEKNFGKEIASLVISNVAKRSEKSHPHEKAENSAPPVG